MNCHEKSEKDDLIKRHTRWVKRPDLSQPNDTDLASAAADAIECLTTIPPETIRVTARNGWLHFEGTVNCCEQRSTLENVTRHLPGVRGVSDSITIKRLPAQAEARVVSH